MNREYLEHTQKILSQILDIPIQRVLPDESINSLRHLDSHGFLFLVLALEEEFGVEFEPEDIEEMLTVKSIVKIVEKRREQH